MPKVRLRRAKRVLDRVPSRSLASRAGWVRKNVVMDQKKLDAARRALGVQTEAEAIDLALDFISFRRELARGIAAIRRTGGIADARRARK